MTKLEFLKLATNVIVGAGTTKIVGQAIKSNTNPQTVTDTVTMAASSVVLGAMAADATKSYTNAKIDEIAEFWNKNVKQNA